MPEVLSILAALCSAVACVLVWRMSSSMGASQGNDHGWDRMKDKLDAQDAQLRDEFARNRKETAELAQAHKIEEQLGRFESRTRTPKPSKRSFVSSLQIPPAA